MKTIARSHDQLAPLRRRRFLSAATFGLAPVLALVAPPAHATMQIQDHILVDGEQSPVLSHNLLNTRYSFVFLDERLGPFITSECSASIRGHMEEWEVRDQKLYLVAIVANPCGRQGTSVPLAVLFPNATGPVHATWFTGTLDIARGKPTPGLQWSLSMAYERHLLLDIRDGMVVARRETLRPNQR